MMMMVNGEDDYEIQILLTTWVKQQQQQQTNNKQLHRLRRLPKLLNVFNGRYLEINFNILKIKKHC